MLPAEGESEFLELVCRYLDNDELTPEEWACLNGQLREDRARRETFVRLCLQAKLIAEGLPIGDPLFRLETEWREGVALTNAPLATSAPIVSVFGGPALGVRGYFPQGMLVSYLVATVLFGLALLGGSFITISPPARPPKSQPNRDLSLPPLMDRSEPRTSVRRSDHPHGQLSLGRSRDRRRRRAMTFHWDAGYALASGFMEITYDTGAKVILQGPATYEVESASGGFLSLGKLTARVEKRGPNQESGYRVEGRANRQPSPAPKVGAGTNHFARPSPLSSRPSPLSPRPSPLSPVLRPHPHRHRHRPWHRVRRRGRQGGSTTSHVFRGAVRLQLVGTRAERRTWSCARTSRPAWRKSNATGGVRLVPPGSVVAPRPLCDG